MENVMFDFRIIETIDGNQIIDRNLKTTYNALTPNQMMKYIEIDAQLSFMDRLERKKRAETEHIILNILIQEQQRKLLT